MASSRGAGVVAALRAGDVRGALSRWADLALAALVVSIVALMIVPLPPAVLDVLIALNIAGAITLLLVSVYVANALRIATFPTLLLLTTLFRIALQVSATRLVLVRGDAGQIIASFGRFVVAGNLVVGVVVFLILTVVQFVVITKGAERVAEVAARFALDALPGQQMSIDAELRAGHIDADEARRRRARLGRESQLFGAMDGAMKFVRGDAVAGLLILAINIGGGLLVGVVQRHMEVGAAARVYTLLTIGEGLVAQLPALILSTAAGIVVTRVASEHPGTRANLGRDIVGQVLGQPRALAVAAVVLAALALVPGLPAVPFLLLAAPLGFVAVRLLRGSAEDAQGDDPHRGPHEADRDRASATQPALVSPLTVELGDALWARLESRQQDGRALAQRLNEHLRQHLTAELGLEVPPVQVRRNPSTSAETHGFRLLLNDVPLREGVVPAGDAAPADVLLAAMTAFVRRYAAALLGIQETQTLLERLARTHPALVREVVPRLVTPAALADVLRRLLDEGVSLRNLKDILEALAVWAPREKDPVSLTEHVRTALRRSISFGRALDGVLGAYRLDPLLEEAVRDAIHRTSGGSTLALEPTLARDIVAAISRAIQRRNGGVGRNGRVGATSVEDERTPVVLTSAEIRRYVRRLLESEHPEVAVLAYSELAPELRVEDLGVIRPT